MKILLVLDNLSAMCGANVSLVCALAEEWKKNGVDLYALTRVDKQNRVDPDKRNLFKKIWEVHNREEEILAEHTQNDEWRNSSALAKAVRCILHPIFLLAALDKKYFGSSCLITEYKGLINKVCITEKFDAVITAVEPYYLAIALSGASVDAKRYIIMSDPYSNSYNRPVSKRNHRIRQEKRVIDKSEGVFALDFVYKDMDYLPEELRNKVHPFKIPKVIKNNDTTAGLMHQPYEHHEKKQNKNEKYIDYVYAGQFYINIRNPEYLLKFFTMLPRNHRLHIYGRGSAEDVVDRYESVLGDRLIRHGWVSAQETQEAINKADILVNLNNNVRNALPSKLIEYINSGKPILNICLIKDCPSLDYMNRYPNGMTIMADDDIGRSVSRVTDFVDESRDRIADHTEIVRLYEDCLNETVAYNMLNMIN